MKKPELAETFPAAALKLSALPTTKAVFLMSKETYEDLLRYAGVPEDEIEQRLRELEESE